MADALVSPAVAGVAAVVSVSLLVVAAKKIRKESSDSSVVPLMGVMGAFIFAAQMINFTIPGTGSSGHIVGGILLGAILGPWAALLTLASVLVVQCLIFADGGLMALGCNILNMGVVSTLIAYPLVFKPIMGHGTSTWRMIVASKTELSGVTALPTGDFLALMTSIHLFIGIGEGLATAAVLYFVLRYKPSLLECRAEAGAGPRGHYGKAAIVFISIALLLGVAFTWIASSNPDGLEWSIENLTGSSELTGGVGSKVADTLAGVQSTTSLLPDYDSTWSGIIGCLVVVAIVWVVASLLGRHQSVGSKA